jgi:hypothetical protein
MASRVIGPLKGPENQAPTGLDPLMSIHKVGIQRAMDAEGFCLRSMLRSAKTKAAHIKRANAGNIISRT